MHTPQRYTAEETVYLSQRAMIYDIPRLFLIGPSGSGKSVIGRRLANELGWRLLDTDTAIRSAHDDATIADLFAEHGEAHFRRCELRLLSQIADGNEPTVVATGGGLPAIPGAMDRIEELGVSVYLHAGVEDLWQRLIGDLEDRPLLREGGRRRLEDLVHEREATYRRATISIDTSRLTVDEVVGLLSAGKHAWRERPSSTR